MHIFQKHNRSDYEELVVSNYSPYMHPSCIQNLHLFMNPIQPETEREGIEKKLNKLLMVFNAEYGPIKLDNCNVS